MGRRLDRLLQALDRLDERAGLNPGGWLDRRLQRMALARALVRFSQWMLRHPVRNAAILAGVSVVIDVPLALLEAEPLLPRILFAVLPWTVVALIGVFAGRFREKRGLPPNTPVQG